MTVYLLITGSLFMLFGVRALFSPVRAVALPNSISADTVDGKSFLRAGSGGVTVAFALAMIAGPFVSGLAQPALWLAVLTLGGLLAGRVVGVVADGVPGITVRIAALGEAVGFGFGCYWLMQTAA